MSTGLDIGPYRLLNKLAKGGMGEVYVAVRRGIGNFEKPMAVKLLLPHLLSDQRAVNRFLDEARVSALMSHPNIAQVFDVGFVDDRYFLAMELVRGASLSGLIHALKKRGTPPSQAVVAWVGRSLCDGLEHAHCLRTADGAVRVVHRDVTPHNVLVSVEGVIKVTDFGIARIRDEGNAQSVFGKLSYMAPEQTVGATVDARADVFGIGATLLHLATLQVPRRREGLKSIDTSLLDLPPPLHHAICWALEEDVEARAPSARALRDAIPQFAHGQAELAALVTSVCADVVEHIDEVSRFSASTGSSQTPELSSRVRAPVLTTPRRWPWLLGAAAVCGQLGWLLLPKAPAPTVAAPVEAVSSAIETVTPPEEPPFSEMNFPPLDFTEPTPAVVPPPLPQRTAKRRATAVGVGYLSVTAEPWAYVFVDGEPIGETPLAGVPLSTGKHLLRWHNPETKQQRVQTIRVVAGKTVFARAELK